MICPQWTEKLLDHVAHELSPEDAILLDQHLADCAPCRLQQQKLEQILAVQTVSEEWSPDPSMAQRIWASDGLRTPQPPASPASAIGRPWRSLVRMLLWNIRRPLPSYAAIILILASGAVGLMLGRSAPRSPVQAWPKGIPSMTPEVRLPRESPPENPAPLTPGRESQALAYLPDPSAPGGSWRPDFVTVQSDAVRLESPSSNDSL